MDILELEIRNNVILNIIGEIWDEKKEIFSIINASKYKNKIKIVPKYIPDNDISEIFNNSDFLVLPYLRGTQSGVLHLGMNYNLPIITTDVGGFKDVLVDYNPKIIVPPNDINSLTQAILKMIHMSNSSSSSKITSSVKVSKGVNESYIKTISNLTKNDFIS
jgi:glycosyltransferase involved in cell wall biosynthesis